MERVRIIRRIDKEFNRKLSTHIDYIKHRLEGDKNYFEVKHFRSEHNIKNHYGLESLGAEVQLALDYEKICILGEIELYFYHNNTFGIAKERTPFYINHQNPLLKMMTIFYGTPFSLDIYKVPNLEFVRYRIVINEVKTKDFNELVPFILLLDECLHQINESVLYD